MNRKINYSLKVKLLMLIFLSLACFSGCVFQTTSALKKIDEQYKHDFFDKLVVNSTNSETVDDNLFNETLNLIDSFIKNYKDENKDKEIAHVKALQSLINLQKGKYDKARLNIILAESYIAKAEKRDEILLKNLPNLIWGIQAAAEGNEFIGDKHDEEKLMKAIRKLDSALSKLDRVNFIELFDVESGSTGGDEICLYLTSARAILHLNTIELIKELTYPVYAKEISKTEEEVSGLVKGKYTIAISQVGEVLRTYMPAEEFDILFEKATFVDDQGGSVTIPKKWFEGNRRLIRFQALYLLLLDEYGKFEANI